MKLKIAGAQIPVIKNIEDNFQTILRALAFAKAEKADILLTPEGSLSGYTYKFDQKQVETLIEGLAYYSEKGRS